MIITPYYSTSKMASNLVLTAEDDIIKKRLLIEGDSGNDDRLINKLCRYFVKWTNSFANGATSSSEQLNASGVTEDESSEYLSEQINACLAHIEFGLLRNQFILDMNKSEQENYKVLYGRINDEIEKAKIKIVESKVELQEARKIRKNRQEYDILARQILNYPDRSDMEKSIKELEAKQEGLKKLENDLDRKLELRRKHFSSVLHALSSMKNMIDNDTKLDDYLATRSSAGDETASLSKPQPSGGNNLQDLLEAKMNSLLNDEANEVAEKRHKRSSEEDLDDDATGSKQQRGKHYAAEVDMEDS